MKPRPRPQHLNPGEPGWVKLTTLVSPHHPTVRLTHEIDWTKFDDAFGLTYSDRGRPGIRTRLMVSLHYLKYTFGLSDEDVILERSAVRPDAGAPCSASPPRRRPTQAELRPVGNRLLVQQSRFTHARQFRRAAGGLHPQAKEHPGRVIRDFERKSPAPSERRRIA